MSDIPILSIDDSIVIAPVAEATTIYAGHLVGRNSSGYAVPLDGDSTLEVMGVCLARAENARGSNGAVSVRIRSGAFVFDAEDGEAPTIADVTKYVYAASSTRIARTDGGGSRPIVGVLIAIDNGKYWVRIDSIDAASIVQDAVDQIEQDPQFKNFARISSYGSSSQMQLYAASGTEDAPTPTSYGRLGRISYRGFNGSSEVESAYILFTPAAPFSESDAESAIIFAATKSGETTPTPSLVVGADYVTGPTRTAEKCTSNIDSKTLVASGAGPALNLNGVYIDSQIDSGDDWSILWSIRPQRGEIASNYFVVLSHASWSAGPTVTLSVVAFAQDGSVSTEYSSDITSQVDSAVGATRINVGTVINFDSGKSYAVKLSVSNASSTDSNDISVYMCGINVSSETLMNDLI